MEKSHLLRHPSGPNLARINFDYRAFARKYGLGEPFAVNYFRSFFVAGEFEVEV